MAGGGAKYPNQQNREDAIRRAFRTLELLNNLSVQSRTDSSPPGTESSGDLFIVGSSPSGAWAGQEDNLAKWDGINWAFLAPSEGFTAWVKDEDVLVVFDGDNWFELEGGGIVTTAGTQTGYRETVSLTEDVPTTINHSLGKQYPAVTILNSPNDFIFIERVTATDANNLEVVAGNDVTVTVVAQANNSGLYNEQVSFTADTPATITHNLGFEWPLVSAYNENDDLFLFHNTNTVDSNELTMEVGRTFTGNVGIYRSPDVFHKTVSLTENSELSVSHSLNVAQMAPVFYVNGTYTLLENMNVDDTNAVKLTSGNDISGKIAVHA